MSRRAPSLRPGGVPPRTATAGAEVPDLDLTPSSSRSAPAEPPPSSRVNAASPRAVSFGGDDDDFGDGIERNIATAVPTASAATALAHRAPAPQTRHAAHPSSNLEITHVRVRKRAAEANEEPAPALFARLSSHTIAAVVSAAAAGALGHLAHRPGGRSLTHVVPHAFDGTSAPESGVVALTSLVIAVLLGFAGLRMTPRSWSFVASGGATLLGALAMVTVTLASTGETPSPPDGVLLLPYLFPSALLLCSIGLARHAGARFAMGGVVRRVTAVAIAAAAGSVAFLAFETSRFA